MTKNLVISHGNCYDGFTAAWVAKRWLPDAIVFFAKHGENPPDVKGKIVYMFDFCYPKQIMETLIEDADDFICFDHHKSAMEDCVEIKNCFFDMKKSGCRLAWDYFCGPDEPPMWLQRVEDRDLWAWNYDDTKYVHAYISSIPMTFDNWDKINNTKFSDLVEGGKAISNFIKTYCERASQEARIESIRGVPVIAVNAPYQMASELGEMLLNKFPDVDYSASYFQREDKKWQFSLRSKDDFDVSKVAKDFNGGGHMNAAGFMVNSLSEVFDGE